MRVARLARLAACPAVARPFGTLRTAPAVRAVAVRAFSDDVAPGAEDAAMSFSESCDRELRWEQDNAEDLSGVWQDVANA
eukprot:gene5015-5127_t